MVLQLESMAANPQSLRCDATRALPERCRARGLIVKGDIVHHKTHLTPDNITDTAITLNFTNLELLCMECHNVEHNTKPNIRAGFVFDADGNIAPLSQD